MLTEKTLGTSINISTSGALIKLDGWPEFNDHEIVKLEIYSDNEVCNPARTKIIKQICAIERIITKKKQIAFSFLE